MAMPATSDRTGISSRWMVMAGKPFFEFVHRAYQNRAGNDGRLRGTAFASSAAQGADALFQIEDVLVLFAKLSECVGQLQQVLEIVAAGAARAEDMCRHLFRLVGAEKSRVVIGGDVEVAGHCSRAVEQADLHAVTLVAVLLAMIEMLEDPVFNAVGHAAADLAGSRHQSYYPARRVGRSPVVVRALPEASRPSRDFCRLALQPGKIHLVDQRTVAKNPVRHGEP